MHDRPTRSPGAISRAKAVAGWLAATLLLASCATPGPPGTAQRTPAQVRAQLVTLLPAGMSDREAWAADIQAALAALEVSPTTAHLCAVVAVNAQESGFVADPVVPGLARIAREEIDRRAARVHVPKLLVAGALRLKSPDGRRYNDRIAAVRTERELSVIFEDFIDEVPLGRRLFANANPVRTGGSMQVSIPFAEAHARQQPYPYGAGGTIRNEVFTRRGGLYFGIAHLLQYPVSYDRMLYRFADFNAGRYASRNAAFQSAVSIATGIPLALDGDLVLHGKGQVGTTEAAVRALAARLDQTHAGIRRALEQGDTHAFETTDVYRRVFEIADATAGRSLPRALVPRIDLESPKITRKLTTEWFASRVDARYRRCLGSPPAD